MIMQEVKVGDQLEVEGKAMEVVSVEAEKKPEPPPEPKKNRHLRRANKSKRAIKKAKAAIAKQWKGFDLSKISGKVIIDGIEIQGEAPPPAPEPEVKDG